MIFCDEHREAVKLDTPPERTDRHVWIDLWNGWYRCGGSSLYSESPEAEALRSQPARRQDRWVIRHREEARRSWELGDLDAAEWHLGQAQRIELARYRRAHSPTSSLGEPAADPDPEATELVRTALLGVELGVLRWNPDQRDWTKGRDPR